MLPWADATLVFSSADKRASVSYVHSYGQGIGFHLKASAPIDQDTHLAALTDTNRLVGGFAGSLQVGLDTRADYLNWLKHQVEEVTGALKQLSSLPDWTSNGLQARFAASVPELWGGSTAAFVHYFCTDIGKARCPTPDTINIPTLLPKLCAKYFEVECTDSVSFYRAAIRYWKKECEHATTVACAAAGFGTDYFQKSEANSALKLRLEDSALRTQIEDAYKVVDPDAGAKLEECRRSGTTAEQCLADRAGAIADALNAFLRTAPLQRRDLLLMAVHDRKQWDLALMLGTSLSYDRFQVYEGDAASKPKPAAAYEFSIGPDITAYAPVAGLSFNARVGYERTRQTGATSFERCSTTTSSDPLVSGKRCNASALFRAGAAPDPEDSGFVRLAMDYQYRGTVSKDNLIPGIEFRGGISGIGQSLAGELRFSLFGTPVSGNAAARVGVALDLHYAIDHDSADDSSRWTVTPLVFIGGTFADLMSN